MSAFLFGTVGSLQRAPLPLLLVMFSGLLLGAFAAMAILGKMDQILAPKGVSMTIAPLGVVYAVLFATPAAPAARKYNIFTAQIGCATLGVIAFSLFGPGWLARSSALAASIAFMIYTGSNHPPAASLPLLFIDGAKLHPLNYWYALFPGAAACILLCLIVTPRNGGVLEGQDEVLNTNKSWMVRPLKGAASCLLVYHSLEGVAAS